MVQVEREGQLIKGKWRIDSRLGDGSTATVYAATHRNGYRVAMKVLHADLAGNVEMRARFLREGYVANTIQHPGVVRILDDDVMEDGAVFLVMELLEGETMEARAERFGQKLPVHEVLGTMDRLLDVLSAAHAQGIVHRDIKPDNIFLTKSGGLKVLDFGLARISEKVTNGMSTRSGIILGTPDFMSPEQASGNSGAVDARSDLWSVGATAFALLSGEPVHKAPTLHEYLMVIASVPARSLADAAPQLPRSVVEVIDRALALDRAHRWGSAREMQGALRTAYPLDESDIVTVDAARALARPGTPTHFDRPLPMPFNADVVTNTALANAELLKALHSDAPSSEPATSDVATLNDLSPQNIERDHAPVASVPATRPSRDASDFSHVTSSISYVEPLRRPQDTSWIPRVVMVSMLTIVLAFVFHTLSVKKKGPRDGAPAKPAAHQVER